MSSLLLGNHRSIAQLFVRVGNRFQCISSKCLKWRNNLTINIQTTFIYGNFHPEFSLVTKWNPCMLIFFPIHHNEFSRWKSESDFTHPGWIFNVPMIDAHCRSSGCPINQNLQCSEVKNISHILKVTSWWIVLTKCSWGKMFWVSYSGELSKTISNFSYNPDAVSYWFACAFGLYKSRQPSRFKKITCGFSMQNYQTQWNLDGSCQGHFQITE